MFNKQLILGDIGFLLGVCGAFIILASVFNLNPILGQLGNAILIIIILIIILGITGSVLAYIQEKRQSNDNSKIAFYLNPVLIIVGIYFLIRFFLQ